MKSKLKKLIAGIFLAPILISIACVIGGGFIAYGIIKGFFVMIEWSCQQVFNDTDRYFP
jgi:hypothetical protein